MPFCLISYEQAIICAAIAAYNTRNPNNSLRTLYALTTHNRTHKHTHTHT